MGAAFCPATNRQMPIVEKPTKKQQTHTMTPQQSTQQSTQQSLPRGGLPLHQYYGENSEEIEDKIAVHFRSQAKIQ